MRKSIVGIIIVFAVILFFHLFSQYSSQKQQTRKKAALQIDKYSREMAFVNKKLSEEFFIKNRNQAGIVSLSNGLQYKVLNRGDGSKPNLNDTVVVHYEGSLINGQVFDSSYRRGVPTTFQLNNVIKGWQIALPLMSVGSRWKIYIPPGLGYGARGLKPAIGPNQVLIYNVHLVSIKK